MTFNVGDKVIVQTAGSYTGYHYVFDSIARETNTRWVTEEHGWFDKSTLDGPRRKSEFYRAARLLPVDDPTALKRMWTETARKRAFDLDRLIRQDRDIDVAKTREAVRALLVALDKLEAAS